MAGHSVTVAPSDDHRSSATGPDPGQPGAGDVGAGDVEAGEIEVAAADLRIELEVEARRRERLIRHRLSSDATLVGALAAAVDLEIALQVVTGERLTGRLVAVGTDVITLRRRNATTWVGIGAITALVSPAPLPAAGPGPDGPSWAEIMQDVVDSGDEVDVGLVAGPAVHGRLASLGDVATISTDPGGRTTYVPVSAIVSVTRRG